MEKNIVLNPERLTIDPDPKRIEKYVNRGWTYNPPSEIDKLKAHRQKIDEFFKEKL